MQNSRAVVYKHTSFLKKYSSRVTKYTRVGDTRVSSYNQAVPYIRSYCLEQVLLMHIHIAGLETFSGLTNLI